ncbi:MAG: hypothetical protein J5802_00135 [Butyrivibrio sp.]|nr:hypothetical protein [Butyrivibrio sp.]
MKKKTTAAILLATALMFALVGCGAASDESANETVEITTKESDKDTNAENETTDADTDADSKDTQESSDTPASVSDAEITYKGASYSPLEDLQTALDKINSVTKPDPDSPLEMDEKNCAYYYDSQKFCIFTFNYNDTETISTIYSEDPETKTSKGIGPGSSKDELIAAYGEPTKVIDDSYLYKFDGYYLNFMLEGDKIRGLSTNHAAFDTCELYE